MITYWQQEAEKICRIEKDSLNSELKTWVDARIVTRDDVELLQKEFQIDPEHILDILDPDEQSRLEDGDGYVLTIIRLPIYDPNAETQYWTIPLGIIIKDNYIITICWMFLICYIIVLTISEWNNILFISFNFKYNVSHIF